MTIQVGLIGRNISYSRSPDIFRVIGESIGQPVQCCVFDIEKESLAALIESLRASALVGCSVTIPYKTDIIRYLDTLDPSAASLQSVNSIQISQGSLTGHNTDHFGFDEMLASAKINPGTSALILGAGGASRAVIASLLDAGLQVTICCRNETQYAESAVLFYEKMSRLSYRQWSEKIESDEYQIVVNTTPLGGANDKSAPCPLQFAKSSGQYFDLNYNADNGWLAAGSSAGWETYDGSRMLIWQAIRSFEIWTGRKVDSQVIYQQVFGHP